MKNRKVKSFGVNASLNIIKTVCGILFPLITFPYISRVLGPENYGKYSFSNSVVSYFLIAAMLGINSYCIREGARIRDDKKALQLFADETTTINLISVVIAYILLAVSIIIVPKFHWYKELILILSITIICTFIGRDWINTVYEDYLYITIRYIVIQCLCLCSILIFVRTQNDYVIYTAIANASVSLGYILNLYYTRRYLKFRLTRHMCIKKHILPIFLLFCGQLATMIYIQSDITMIGFIKSDYDVGVYSFSSKIYLLSKSVINAITTVAIPRIVYYLGKDDQQQYNRFSSKIAELLLLIGIPSVIGLVLLSKEILILLGGNQYIQGILCLQILGIALIFAIFSGFFANALIIPNRKEQAFLVITIVAALLNISLNLVLVPRCGINGAAITTLLSEVFVLLFARRSCKHIAKLSIDKHNVLTICISSCFVLLVCLITKRIIESAFLCIIVSIIMAVVLYCCSLLLLNNTLFVAYVNIIKEKLGM